MHNPNYINPASQTSPPDPQLYQTQQLMAQPPNIISTKDHLYLKDALSWTLTASKKCHFYAQNCTDPEIRHIFMQLGQIHQRQYQALLNHTHPQHNAQHITRPTY
ncbi:MAG: hypothetical protein ACUVTU_03920 [Desulfurispora sp.]|uniref:hypothetical protein n=1 Tax=Desulfurispora sp. TaxID=3014275 RepID=UPI00404A31D5